MHDWRSGVRLNEATRGGRCLSRIELGLTELEPLESVEVAERDRCIDTQLGADSAVGDAHVLMAARTWNENHVTRRFHAGGQRVLDVHRVLDVNIVVDDDDAIQVLERGERSRSE